MFTIHKLNYFNSIHVSIAKNCLWLSLTCLAGCISVRLFVNYIFGTFITFYHFYFDSSGCLFVCLSTCPAIRLSVCLSAHPSVYLFVHLSVFIRQSFRLSLYPAVFLYIWLFVVVDFPVSLIRCNLEIPIKRCRTRRIDLRTKFDSNLCILKKLKIIVN